MSDLQYLVIGLAILAVVMNLPRMLAAAKAQPATTPLQPLSPIVRYVEAEARTIEPSLAAMLALVHHKSEADGLMHLANTTANAIVTSTAGAKATSPLWSGLAPQAPPNPSPTAGNPPTPAAPVPNP